MIPNISRSSKRGSLCDATHLLLQKLVPSKKKPTALWSEEQARTAHRSKQPYTALVGSTDQPYCFVDVADKVIGVGFLDASCASR